MKLKKYTVCMMAGLLLLAPMLITQAQETTQTTQVDNATPILDVKQKEFKFVGEEEGSIENPNYPIRIRIEDIEGNQANIRMIWNLQDRSLDEVFPITITPTRYDKVPMVPDGSQQDVAFTITFNDTDRELYGGQLYITDLLEYGGEQLLLKDVAGIHSKEANLYMLMTETPIQDENPQESTSTSQTETEQTTENMPEQGLDFTELDRRISEWADKLGGKFYRIDPPNKAELDHWGLSLDELTNYMNLDGEEVNPDLSKDYKQIAVYSNSIQGDSQNNPITYFLLEVNGQAQVWVSEQADTSKRVEFKQSENAEMQQLFQDWLRSNYEEEGPQPFPSESMAAKLMQRDTSFDSEQALELAQRLWFPDYSDIDLQMGSNEVTLEENHKVTVTIEEKAPGYYYFHQSSGAMGQSFDYFISGDQIVTLRQAYDPITYSILDYETLQENVSDNLTAQEAEDLKAAEKELGLHQEQ